MDKDSEQVIAQKLKSLSNTQASIQSTSNFILELRGSAKLVSKLWYKYYKTAHVKQKVTLLYLANDVIQNGRKKCPEYLQLFQMVLPSAFKDATKFGDTTTRGILRRLLSIWQERKIYKPDFLNSIQKIIARYESEDKNSPVEKSSKHHHHNRKRESVAPKSPEIENDPVYTMSEAVTSTQSHTTTTVSSSESNAMTTSSISSESVHSFRSVFDKELRRDSVNTVELSELLKLLKELQNPSSADAVVRETIAKFPTEVSSLSAVDKIRSKAENKLFSNLVEDSAEIVRKYNERLEEEIETRKQLALSLRQYLVHQTDRIKLSEARYADCLMKHKRASTLHEKCEKHLEKLPDLPVISPTEETIGLPSIHDLFE